MTTYGCESKTPSLPWYRFATTDTLDQAINAVTEWRQIQKGDLRIVKVETNVVSLFSVKEYES